MRSLLPLTLLALTFAACRCSPEEATPVTFRIKNTLTTPIYVDATDGRDGLVVKRNILGEWMAFVEAPACECLSCDLICGGCECEKPLISQVVKVLPGESHERAWSGVVQLSGTGPCASAFEAGPACLNPENPPVDEEFQLELCYALSAPGAEDADAGVPVPGSLPEIAVLCEQRTFRVEDGLVEISPTRGADCSEHSQCEADELCFSGGCTRACPDPDFPIIGGSWQVAVAKPDNTGFFERTQTSELVTYEGTGTVGSVRYENNTMILQLGRPGSVMGSTLRGTIYVTLPPGLAVPISMGETVSVRVLDASTDKNPENRAVVIRDAAGVLLLATETAQQKRILDAAATAPFTVTRVAGKIVGCAQTECGKNLFGTMRFAAGSDAIELGSGRNAELVTAGQSWKVANVGDSHYADTWCGISDLSPFAIVNQRVSE